ncbi:Asp23/Gls24 family envelope stress response protein [Desulfallas thermosapovorans]|uniref:Putative alkaline shock family protein YloU n=1 Tax=Desulfallas thermosapovorans DSM 6562 TaxID=1121431 RepID=A0A5S4ZXV6_9FIRM|nr:Asp23/Gls24 family envelope stress response protein [Desulfallas thermosapovorans]TYO97748.1 putative alkaline shock family protein YloU [Desulfallas thermosapovorans DSM 6562]
MEVYALVGPSGTGKSHRAVMLAGQLGCEIIIDDGLIIKGNRIVAGESAKKQPTRIGAIKTALFINTEHRRAAVEAISLLSPEKVLILGTSRGMAERIASGLSLPDIKKYISIEQIASAKEMRKARIMRTQHSKHVIPAPIMEVKKSFPESMIDPLQVFLRRKGPRGRTSWTEQSVVRPTFTLYGRFSISRGAIGSIASYAAAGIDGVMSVRHTNIIREGQDVTIELSVVANINYKLDNISREVQKMVKRQVEYMTGLTVKYINVTIVDIKVSEIS